jgi:hypothetical protein
MPPGFLLEIMEIIKLVILELLSGKNIERPRLSSSARVLYFEIFFEKKVSKLIKD